MSLIAVFFIELVGYLSLEEKLESSKDIVLFLNESNIKLTTNLNEGICEIELNEQVLGIELRNENIASRASELAKEEEIRNAIIKDSKECLRS